MEIKEWLRPEIDKEFTLKAKMIVTVILTIFEFFNQYFYNSSR